MVPFSGTTEMQKGGFFLVGRPDGKRPIVSLRRRLEGSIKTDVMTWSGLIWLRLGTSCGVL